MIMGRRHGVPLCLLATALVVSLLATVRSSHGCAAVFSFGSSVVISEESAIIVWDPVAKIQHFIRRAAFQARPRTAKEAADFGFLVPTPTIPELAEVGKEAFASLADLMARRETRKSYRARLTFCTPLGMLGSKAERDFSNVTAQASGVQVLLQQQVAGYDAAVLEAADGKALNVWLGKNGYVSRPALVDWLDHYVKGRWKITAFKIAQKPAAPSAAQELFRPVATGAVRMSFATSKPFFPYREPAETKEKPQGQEAARRLQVFFLGRGRMSANLGEQGSKPWPAAVRWTAKVPDADRRLLTTQLDLPADQLPDGTWLTAFEDPAVVRPNLDLFFETAGQQTPILPPPIIVYTDIPIPLDLILASIVLVAVILRLRRRQVRSPQGPSHFIPF